MAVDPPDVVAVVEPPPQALSASGTVSSDANSTRFLDMLAFLSVSCSTTASGSFGAGRSSGGGWPPVGADYLMPENPIELTILRPKAAKRMMIGNAATRAAAIRPAQSGLPCGVCDLKTPRATVRTRTLSLCPTSSGQKYSFQALMKVSRPRVVMGAALSGRMI